MRSLVAFFFTLDAIVLSFLATALWLLVKPGSRAARRVAVSFALFYLVLTTYGLNVVFVRLLSSGFEPFAARDIPPPPIAIVVLGSGSSTVRDWNDREFSSVDATAAARVLEAVRVYELMTAARPGSEPPWVISSGGKVSPTDRNAPTGITMQDSLLRLGVPAGRVLLEGASHNTHEEAVAIKAMLPGLGSPRVVIVTSGIHMRRSVGTFRSVGIDPIPAVARPAVWSTTWRERLLPTPIGLWQGSNVMHEAIGLVHYAATGRFSLSAAQTSEPQEQRGHDR